MDSMATMSEKIVDMLATIREMRKMLGKKNIILDTLITHGSLSQYDLLKKISPKISERTARRHLEKYIAEGLVVRTKDGRRVVYTSK